MAASSDRQDARSTSLRCSSQGDEIVFGDWKEDWKTTNGQYGSFYGKLRKEQAGKGAEQLEVEQLRQQVAALQAEVQSLHHESATHVRPPGCPAPPVGTAAAPPCVPGQAAGPPPSSGAGALPPAPMPAGAFPGRSGAATLQPRDAWVMAGQDEVNGPVAAAAGAVRPGSRGGSRPPTPRGAPPVANGLVQPPPQEEPLPYGRRRAELGPTESVVKGKARFLRPSSAPRQGTRKEVPRHVRVRVSPSLVRPNTAPGTGPEQYTSVVTVTEPPPLMERPATSRYDYYKYYGYAGQGAKTSWAHNYPLGRVPPVPEVSRR